MKAVTKKKKPVKKIGTIEATLKRLEWAVKHKINLGEQAQIYKNDLFKAQETIEQLQKQNAELANLLHNERMHRQTCLNSAKGLIEDMGLGL